MEDQDAHQPPAHHSNLDSTTPTDDTNLDSTKSAQIAEEASMNHVGFTQTTEDADMDNMQESAQSNDDLADDDFNNAMDELQAAAGAEDSDDFHGSKDGNMSPTQSLDHGDAEDAEAGHEKENDTMPLQDESAGLNMEADWQMASTSNSNDLTLHDVDERDDGQALPVASFSLGSPFAPRALTDQPEPGEESLFVAQATAGGAGTASTPDADIELFDRPDQPLDFGNSLFNTSKATKSSEKDEKLARLHATQRQFKENMLKRRQKAQDDIKTQSDKHDHDEDEALSPLQPSAARFEGAMPLSTGSQARDPTSTTPDPEDSWAQVPRSTAPSLGPAFRVEGLLDQAAESFKRAKVEYKLKRLAKTATLEDDIEFMKLEANEKARLRKLRLDNEYNLALSSEQMDTDRISLPEETPEDADGQNFNTMYSDDDVIEKMPAKRKRKCDIFIEDDKDDDEAFFQPKKRGQPKAKKARKAATGGKKIQGPAKKKIIGPNMTNVDNFMGTDVFRDTHANQNMRNQPLDLGVRPGQKNAGPKYDALKTLISSLPVADQKAARTDSRQLDNAMKEFTGQGSVRPAADGNWSVKGMKSTLKHYQVMGVAFMRRRENDSKEPKGGILADAMGLGKTVMMLANIVNGQPKSGKKITTLIVASPALVTQWMSEIGKHCVKKDGQKQAGLGLVMQYRSGNKPLSNDDEAILQTADIVLTTYYEVSKSYPKAIVPTELTTAVQKEQWWRDHYEDAKGVLHRIKFLRVVLDEAQAIKNHRGHTSMACRGIQAKHHWAITGTPAMNSIKEFYPYFKFIGEPNTGSFKIFKENFCNPGDPDGVEKLGVFLRKVMIRRTHLDQMFGARLLDLPTPQEHTLWLEFNEVERQIYEIVKQRFVERINAISKQGGLEKQYSHIWTMILRLRQICGHIMLVQGTIIDLLQREDFEKLNKITQSEEDASDEGMSLLMHLRTVLKNNQGLKTIEGGIQGSVMSEDETVPLGLVDGLYPDVDVGGMHGLSFRFRRYLDSLVQSEHWDKIKRRTTCSGCRQPPGDPMVTSCFHIYCQACLTLMQHRAARQGKDHATCSECGEQFTSAQACDDLKTFLRRDSTLSIDSNATIAPTMAPKKTSKKEKDLGMLAWTEMNGTVLPSAKTQATKAQILNWIEEDPEVKIIVYTQFLPMIKVLSRICVGEQWNSVNYTGEMSHDSRDKALHDFGNNPDIRIMLASLKCGGLGLNLTMASRVICLDPWWNSAVEQQAFCRVFRIGQQNETRMTRFVIKNTVDAAMMAVKERKQVEIDELMESSSKNKLGVTDLMRLFGNVGEDEDGKAFIFADSTKQFDDDADNIRLPNMDEEDDEEQHMGNEE